MGHTRALEAAGGVAGALSPPEPEGAGGGGGAGGAEAEGRGAGWTGDGAGAGGGGAEDAGSTGFPHSPQNLTPGATGRPHAGHGAYGDGAGAGIPFPQFPQNLVPAVTGAPQDGQLEDAKAGGAAEAGGAAAAAFICWACSWSRAISACTCWICVSSDWICRHGSTTDGSCNPPLRNAPYAARPNSGSERSFSFSSFLACAFSRFISFWGLSLASSGIAFTSISRQRSVMIF